MYNVYEMFDNGNMHLITLICGILPTMDAVSKCFALLSQREHDIVGLLKNITRERWWKATSKTWNSIISGPWKAINLLLSPVTVRRLNPLAGMFHFPKAPEEILRIGIAKKKTKAPTIIVTFCLGRLWAVNLFISIHLIAMATYLGGSINGPPQNG